ncbi:MAG: hypothetical protein AAF618_02665 [Pseudomonadota bacterium]
MVILTLLVVLWCGGLCADTVRQAPKEFNENLREEAEISGALFAGIMRAGDRPSGADISISAEIPTGWAMGPVCLRVTTSNGLYESEAEYDLGGAENAQLLDFPTSFARYLRDRPEDGVATMLSKGGCGADVEDVALVNWADPSENAPRVLLNSFSADRVYLYLGAADTPIQCAPLEGIARAAYDTRCDLDAEKLDAPLVLEIFAVRNGQPAEPAFLTLHPLVAP